MDKTHDLGWPFQMNEPVNPLDVLKVLLRAPLRITGMKSQVFPAGWRTPDEVIVTHRFLLIREGRMNYTVEGVTRRLGAGTQFFVPAWCRREWVVPVRTGGCRLMWCEFSSGAVTLPPVLCRRRPGALRAEVTAFAELGRVVAQPEDRAVALRAEGLLKACLARFWTEAEAEGGRTAGAGTVHREVSRAVAWLERHYAEPEALEAFYRTVELSPNHFRLLFRRQTGETVQAVLARLRLRRARYLVQETAMPMKRIAAETGFADPLYFSNQYRKFWGRAASADRVAGGVA